MPEMDPKLDINNHLTFKPLQLLYSLPSWRFFGGYHARVSKLTFRLNDAYHFKINYFAINYSSNAKKLHSFCFHIRMFIFRAQAGYVAG